MEEQELLDTIVGRTYTKTDVTRRLRMVREYFEAGYFTGDETELTKFMLSRRATTEDLDAFLSWGEKFFSSFNRETMYKVIKHMSEMAKKLPSLTLYIPYEPVPAEIVKLGKWFRENVSNTLILDIRTDVTLLGGCAFAKKGVYHDYSLRYYMRKRREEITKVITEYVERFYRE